MVATGEGHSDEEIRLMAGQFKAMAHPVRLKILLRLADGECCVCDLVELSGIGFSAVSRHLSVMKSAGLVSDEKRGQKVFYRLLIPCVTSFTSCLGSVSRGEDYSMTVCCQ